MAVYFDAKKQRWRFDYQGTVAGRRIRATKLLPAGWSKQQAREFEAAEIARITREVSTGKRPEPSIEDCVLAYLTAREGTKGHKTALEHFRVLLPYYQGRPLEDLKAIASEVAKRMRAPGEPPGKRDPKTKQYARWSRGTVHNRLAYLHAACKEAYEQDLVSWDPTKGMAIPAADNEQQVYADRALVLRIARACDRPDARALVLLGYYTGMRLGELMRCRVVGETLALDDTKNGTPRIIPLHRRALRLAHRHLPFSGPKITLQRAVMRARTKAGAMHIKIHTLRHSSASAMVNAGVDLFTVGKVLGHKDTRSTKRYAHLETVTLAAAVSKIGQRRV